MKIEDVKVGQVFKARVSNNFVPVQVKSIGHSRINGQMRTRFLVKNLATGRELVFKSAQRFRSRAVELED